MFFLLIILWTSFGYLSETFTQKWFRLQITNINVHFAFAAKRGSRNKPIMVRMMLKE